VRASALKQFGLLAGKAEAYKASDLAKAINAAVPEQRQGLLQDACLKSQVFGRIFGTLKGDNVSKARIEQVAKELNVHPESAPECAQLFIYSAVTAGLATVNGDSIGIVPATTASAGASQPTDGEPPLELESDENEVTGQDRGESTPVQSSQNGQNSTRTRQNNTANVTVSLKVDSSSDPDKLEKQLKLLREYGVI
jgi:hypothetical protein